MAKSSPQINLFKIINPIRRITHFIFWLILIFSFIPSIFKYFNIHFDFISPLNFLNVILISFFFVLDITVDYILIPQADGKRRDDFLDNSFGCKFSPNSSVEYHDNDEISHGLYKAACNLFANCFFTYNLLKSLTLKKILLPSIAFICLAYFSYIGFQQSIFTLSLLQALFSATLLGSLIKHFILIIKLDSIQESLITLFQNKELRDNIIQYDCYIFRYWLQYEALLSKIPAEIPFKTYDKLNPKLTEEWKAIKVRYRIG